MPRYDAFISYSRKADTTLSALLQSGLRRFAKPWYRRRALHIFRDSTALAPDAPLPVAIETAIGNSGYFILLASPESAKSPWIRRELEFWRQRHGVDRLLLVLTGGTLNWSDTAGDFDPDNSSALPPPLFSAFAAEPLYLDLRGAADPGTDTRDDPRVQDAIATLAAVIHKRPKDDLVGEDILQHRRTLRIAWGAAGLLLLLAVATSLVSIWALQQRDIATARETQARAGQLAANSARLLAEQPEDLELATLLAIESVKRAAAGDGQRALAAATRLLPDRVAESFGEQVYELAFSPNKRWLARGDAQMGAMLWDFNSGQIDQLSTPAEIYDQLQVRDLAFSQDSNRLAIASGGSSARVYELPAIENELEFDHDDTVVTVAFDPAGKWLATGARDGYLRVWDLATRSLILAEPMGAEEVRAVRFNVDGSLLGAVATNGPIRLLATSDWGQIELERVPPDVGLALAFSPDGTLFTVNRANRAVTWSLEDGRVITTVEHSDFAGDLNMEFQTHIWDLAFSPDSSLLVTSSRDRTTRFWRPESGEEVLRLTHRTPVDNVAFAADGNRIATAGYGLVQLWSLPDGVELLRAPTDGGNAMALSEDGTLIATGGSESSIRVMRTASAARTGQLGHADDVVAVECHPERPLVATADDDHNVRIWDAAADAVLASTSRFGARQLRFAASGELFIGGMTGLYRMGLSGAVQKLSPDRHREMALHRDNVAVIAEDGSILVWSAPGDGDPVTIDARAHGDITFNETGTILLSSRYADNRGTAHAWSASTGEELWRVEVEYAFGNRLAANASGETLAVANENTLTLFDKADGSSTRHELDARVRGMVFLDAGARLAVLLDRELLLFDSGDLAARPATVRHDDTISFAAFNGDRSLVATTTGPGVAVWDLATGEKLADWATDARVSRMCFLAGDDALVIGDDANLATVRPWRVPGLVDASCARLTRNLTDREWAAYLHGVPYQDSCPGLEPLSRERLVETMNPRTVFDEPE